MKHAALVHLMHHLRRKPKPFAVFDVHAGAGRYDLGSAEANKTKEYEFGIRRAMAAAPPPQSLASYVDLVRRANPSGGLSRYPGSSALIRMLLRPKDRLVLSELHPEEFRLLQRSVAGDRRIEAHRMDAYAAIKAFLPPKERRGLVLIDPPYEEKNEAERIVRGLKDGHRRFATGIFVIWYPIKDPAATATWHESLVATGIHRQLVAELSLRPAKDPAALNGCGLVVVNPPWRFEAIMDGLLGDIRSVLDLVGGGHEVRWLVAE
jgi:23S rRNA (adenine2030-N6)-methyltransferase